VTGGSPLLFWGLLAVAVSLAATLAAERVARRLALVAVIRDDRWHRAPVPLLGGAAIAATTTVLLAAAGWGSRDVAILAVVSLGMAVMGLVDDLRPLPPQIKLLVQVMLAAVLMHFGFSLPLTEVPLLDVFITLLWLVGITNAFNLLDNMDGLAATIALIAAGFRVVFLMWDGEQEVALATTILMGAAAGFLLRNFPPASIFMGDAGSLYLGFFLAGLSLTPVVFSRGTIAVLAIPVMLLLIPIFDTSFVTITRLLSGRSPAVGGRDHTSHRLVAVGLSERQTLLCLGSIAALSGLVAAVSYHYGFSYAVGLLMVLMVGVVQLGIYLSRVHVVTGEPGPEARGVIRLIANFQYKRQVATLIMDLVLIVLAYYSAYVLRFEDELGAQSRNLLVSLPAVLIVQLAALAAFGVHRGIWQYTGVHDALRIGKAVTVGTVGIVGAMVFLYRFETFSRSVFVLYWVLLIFGMAATRLSFRMFAEVFRAQRPSARRVLIYGAGAGGELIVRQLISNARLGRVPVGLIDDDRAKHQTRIHGVAVLGDREQIRRIVSSTGATEVIVSSAKIAGSGLSELSATCQELGVSVRRATLELEQAG
jgi:UDP-GlcNAc:undecaprenyl-phosphate GlcNAc-1-phosphate transferase